MPSYSRRTLLSLASRTLALAPLSSLEMLAAATEPSLSLAPWSPGTLDIHHISTGRGSCAFLMCPDGTTLMIDAGSILSHFEPYRDKFLIDPRPNESLRPGQWIARYVQSCMAEAERKEIDYFLLTHFHEDHMGEVAPGNFSASPKSRFGNYQLGGLTDVAELIPIKTIIDRNYPSYDYPVPQNGPQVRNYKEFGRSFIERGGRIERIIPGSRRQITLTQEATKFPSFSIRNLAANGEVWTGIGEETRHYFPPLDSLDAKDYPTENKCSLAIRLSYGKFDYFSAGDMDHEVQYGHLPWGDIESVVAKASGPVEVAVADHHGWVDACGPEWVEALRAKVYVINAWDSAHPTMTSLNNMLSKELYPDPRMIFSTAMKPESVIALRRIAEITSQNGHVIFRISPGGHSFEVFIKDSGSEKGKIIARFGPFLCN
jgi:beta-lactamase superfamily II metal-dependent hydrolase